MKLKIETINLVEVVRVDELEEVPRERENLCLDCPCNPNLDKRLKLADRMDGWMDGWNASGKCLLRGQSK